MLILLRRFFFAKILKLFLKPMRLNYPSDKMNLDKMSLDETEMDPPP